MGRPTPPIAKEDWVLMRPGGEDKEMFLDGIEQAAQAIETWGQAGLTAAMNEWNRKET